jgi:glycosyltransferase involved in cell wall biosynthesis
MFYSVIVASYNRHDEIRELLDSFETLDFPHELFELVIVDDGSTDGTLKFLKSFQIRAPFKFRYVTQENRGPGAARNLGMENARGDYFIFIDSDCSVPPSWLTEIDKILQKTQADAFGGPDSYRKDFPALLKAINYTMTSFLTTGGLRGKKGKKLAKFYPRSFNMGISRKLADKIGGFGNLRHGQDIEYSHRIIEGGATVEFIEHAPVYHKRRTNIRRFYRQVFNWGVARINLYKINSTMLEPLHMVPAVATLLSLAVLCLAFYYNFFQYILYGGIFLAVGIVVYSIIDAFRMYKELKPALLIPFILPAQIYGYGAGFIYNYVRRIIFNKGEKVGFKKTYYK